MNDLIRRSELKQLINSLSSHWLCEWDTLGVLAAVDSIPAVDAVEVVRGKWRFEIGDGKTCVDGWVCTNCNCGFHTNVPYFEGFDFCPNCGADMREES